MNRGQVTGQVFIYILTAIVIGVILIFGIRAVLKILKTGEEVEFVQFKIDFENRLKKNMQHGVIDDKAIDVPGGFKNVCFVQVRDNGGFTSADPNIPYPLVYNSWRDHVEDNIFFVDKDVKDSMYVKGLKVKNPFWLCEPVVHGKIINIRFMGTGDGVLVEKI